MFSDSLKGLDSTFVAVIKGSSNSLQRFIFIQMFISCYSRYVMVGNHRDAWGFGAMDPSSGTASMLEVARVLGEKLKTGWRPRRTIIFLSWGAEEFGLTGLRFDVIIFKDYKQLFPKTFQIQTHNWKKSINETTLEIKHTFLFIPGLLDIKK